MALIQTLSCNFRKSLTPLCRGLLQIAKVVELAKNRKILELSSFEGAEQPLYNTYRTLQLVDILSQAKLFRYIIVFCSVAIWARFFTRYFLFFTYFTNYKFRGICTYFIF